MLKDVTNEQLAQMIQRGFESVETRFEGVDSRMDRFENRLDRMEGRLDHMDARLGRIEADMHELRGSVVYRLEFEDLMARVKYLEANAGVESGK